MLDLIAIQAMVSKLEAAGGKEINPLVWAKLMSDIEVVTADVQAEKAAGGKSLQGWAKLVQDSLTVANGLNVVLIELQAVGKDLSAKA